MSTKITDDEVFVAFCTSVQQSGSQRKWAMRNGFTPSYVNDLLLGRRPISKAVAEKIGYRKIESITWERIAQ